MNSLKLHTKVTNLLDDSLINYYYSANIKANVG